MNIIILTEQDLLDGIPSHDWRFKHITKILKLSQGDTFFAGMLMGAKGVATLVSISESIKISFKATQEPDPLYPIHLICGLPRPPVARRVLKDATTAGVCSISFITVQNSEKSYAQSSLWTSDNLLMALLEGAQQGVTTLLPKINHYHSVSHFFQKNSLTGDKIILDNIDTAQNLCQHLALRHNISPTYLAIGSERGWTDRERQLFQVNKFKSASLGKRVIRTETAISAASLMAISIKNLYS